MNRFLIALCLCLTTVTRAQPVAPAASPARKTVVAISGRTFLINGKPTYEGRTFRGMKVEGLLLNSRMVQGIFDDANPQTRDMWRYPDGPWDPERNTREFVAAMPAWRKAGLLSFTINLQGGHPQGYGGAQTWLNSAYDPDGTLRPAYLARLERILDKADELGMVPIVGLFYFGQEPRLADEAAVIHATDTATDWIIARRYTNVLIEIANECNGSYKHPIIKPARAHELIKRVQERSAAKIKPPNGIPGPGRLLVSTSYGGGTIPGANVAEAADFLLLHGNGVADPQRIRQMVQRTRALATYHSQPILFNEDDHYDFDKPDNNFIAAVSEYASWGLFDFRKPNEGFDEGYQSVPANWSPDRSARKRGFFGLVAEMSGSNP